MDNEWKESNTNIKFANSSVTEETYKKKLSPRTTHRKLKNMLTAKLHQNIVCETCINKYHIKTLSLCSQVNTSTSYLFLQYTLHMSNNNTNNNSNNNCVLLYKVERYVVEPVPDILMFDKGTLQLL